MKTTEIEKKRRQALIVVCSLGIGGICCSRYRPLWLNNIFEGTSMESGLIGFVLRMVSYIFLGALLSAVLFVVNLFRLIYYSLMIRSR